MPAEPAGQAAARAGDGRVRARGLVAHAPGGRADPLRHQRRPAPGGGGGPLPPGPALPPQHDRDPPAAAARAAARTSRCSPRTSCASTRSATASASTGFDAARAARAGRHPWPGNVRELDHAVERAVLMAQGDRDPGRATWACSAAAATRRARLEDMSLEEVEAFLIKKALRALRRQRQPRGRGARPVAQRALPAPAALRPLGGRRVEPAAAPPRLEPRRAACSLPAPLRRRRCRGRRWRCALLLAGRRLRAAHAVDARRLRRASPGWLLASRSRRARWSRPLQTLRTCWPRCARRTSRSAPAPRRRRRAGPGHARGERARRHAARAAAGRAGGDARSCAR